MPTEINRDNALRKITSFEAEGIYWKLRAIAEDSGIEHVIEFAACSTHNKDNQLLAYTNKERFPNFGKKSVQELKEFLHLIGVPFGSVDAEELQKSIKEHTNKEEGIKAFLDKNYPIQTTQTFTKDDFNISSHDDTRTDNLREKINPNGLICHIRLPEIFTNLARLDLLDLSKNKDEKSYGEDSQKIIDHMQCDEMDGSPDTVLRLYYLTAESRKSFYEMNVPEKIAEVANKIVPPAQDKLRAQSLKMLGIKITN